MGDIYMTNIVELLKAQELAKSGVLCASPGFKLASENELLEICNGCGASGSWFRPPKTIYGTLIVFACHIHDYAYQFGTTAEDKDEADRTFHNNMNRLITRDEHIWYKPTFLQRRRALKYYLGVKYGGGEAFWAGKN